MSINQLYQHSKCIDGFTWLSSGSGKDFGTRAFPFAYIMDVMIKPKLLIFKISKKLSFGGSYFRV